MANSNPSQVVERVILGPEHKAAEVLAYFLNGRTDGEAVRMWALSCVVDMTQAAEVTALLQMVPAGDVAAIIAKQQEFAAKRSASSGGFRITFSEAGRAVLNGFKLNSNAEGKGGAPLSVFPSQLSAMVDGLPLLISAVLDNADTLIAATATEKDQTEAWANGIKAGKTAKQLRDSGVSQYVERPHKRAGKSALVWEGCDKPATVAKLRGVLEALRSVKPGDGSAK